MTMDEHDLEILKAVAQAWHGHSSSCRSTNEFDANRRNFKNKPTRFKLEATSNSSAAALDRNGSSRYWDFGQSLWDSYEIVAVSKKLESGLVLDDQSPIAIEPGRIAKRRTEGKNSLRNLMNRISSRRFNEGDLLLDEGTQF